jgi:3-oxoacyl-[acyl-carrier-protein] synthase II
MTLKNIGKGCGVVAITGTGLMCGLGLDLASSWKRLLQGNCISKKFTLFDAGSLSCDFGFELPYGADEKFAEQIKTRNRNQMTRATMIAVTTAAMAVEDSMLFSNDTIDKSRVGVVLGSAGTGYSAENSDSQRILRNMVSAPSSWVSLKWKILGPSFTISTACASGAYALHTAHSLITSGQCDAVICGAADSSINVLDVAGFCSLLALSEDKERFETASRPFDRSRSGFVMGEGGGTMVVESIEHAQRRGAKIIATMSAPGLYSEGYNILSPEPDGRGMAQSMRIALANARLEPNKIDYINAHGTSTDLNDRYETKAIKDVFGNETTIPVSSTKSVTGHCLGAAASVEAVLCCKSLQENVIPPTANLTDPDPELTLDYVPLIPREKIISNVMSNSFAFGGHNGVCIFSKPQV